MAEAHWTEKNISEFVNRISFDFITQLAKKMESLPLKQGEFAKKLGLTSGRISQIFNNPGNLTLNKIVKYARALGLKVSVVAYDDGDHDNKEGPISSEIFSTCWETAGKPKDFWSFRNTAQSAFHSGEFRVFFSSYQTAVAPGTANFTVLRNTPQQVVTTGTTVLSSAQTLQKNATVEASNG